MDRRTSGKLKPFVHMSDLAPAPPTFSCLNCLNDPTLCLIDLRVTCAPRIQRLQCRYSIIYAYVSESVSMFECIYIYMYIHTGIIVLYSFILFSICLFIYLCIYVFVGINKQTHTHTHIYIYIY